MLLENKLVSVVITTYGRPFSFLNRAFQSVKKQSYQNKEIIIVNDNGKESSYFKEINSKIGELEDAVYISDGVNRGACGARNVGMRVANGFYIAFLDDDDAWHKDKLSTQIKKFDKKTVMVTCRTRRIYLKNGCLHEKNSVFLPDVISPKMLYTKNWVNGCSCPLIVTETLKQQGGFDETLPALQDYDCWIKLISRGKIRAVNKPLTDVYYHELNRISSNPGKRITGIQLVKERYYGTAPQKKAFLCTCNLNLLREYKKTENQNFYTDFLKKTLKEFYVSPVHIVNLLKIMSEE